MSNKSTPNFLEYVEQNFANNPDSIFDRFYSDADAFFSAHGLDLTKSIDKSRTRIGFNLGNSQKIYAYKPTSKKVKGSFYLSAFRREDGVLIPSITSATFGSVAGKATWTASDALWQEFEGQRNAVRMEEDRRKIEERRRKIEERRRKIKEEQEARAKKLELEKQKAEALRKEVFETYYGLYIRGDSADGSDEYSQRKGIHELFGTDLLKNVKYLPESVKRDDKKGKAVVYKNKFSGHLAVPIYADFGGKEIVGFERIHEDKKLQLASEPGALSEAFFPIGSLPEALANRNGKIFLVEGFSTGLSAYLAAKEAYDQNSKICVLVCFSAGGLKSVAKRISRIINEEHGLGPARFRVLADNDDKASGNTGLFNAIEIFEEYGIQAIYPRFDQKGSGTDFNDLHVIEGLPTAINQIALESSKYCLEIPKDATEKALLKLKFCQKRQEQEMLKKVLLAAKLKFPKLSREDLLFKILQARPSLDAYKIKREINRMAAWAIEEANRSRDFTQAKLNDPQVKHIKVEAEVGLYGEPTLPSSVLDIIKKVGGGIVLKAPMGSSKTEKVLAPLMIENEHASYWCHRRSLVADFHARVNGIRQETNTNSSEIIHYESIDAEFSPYVTKLAGVINSFWKFTETHKKIDVLCFDEASQGLHTVSQSITVGNRVQLFDELLNAARISETVVLADADANDGCIDFLKQARPNEQITVIEMIVPAAMINKKMKVVGTEAEITLEIIDKLCEGEKIYLAMDADGGKFTEHLQKSLADIGQDKKILLINAKADEEALAFFTDAESYIKSYDLIITSPTVSSGVSIKNTDGYISSVYGIFNATVTPSDALQMLARVRNSKEIKVYSSAPTSFKETNITKLMANKIQLAKANAELVDGKLIVEHQLTEFDRFQAFNQSLHNSSYNNWVQNLWLQALKIGWSVEFESQRLSNTFIDSYDVSSKKSKKKVKEERIQSILAAEDLTNEEAEKLRFKYIKSKTDHLRLSRLRVQKALGTRDISSFDVEFILEDFGTSKLRRYEQLIDALELDCANSKHFDRVQDEAGATLYTRGHKTINSVFGAKIIKYLDLEYLPDTGRFEGVFSSQDLNAALEKVKNDQPLCKMAELLGLKDPRKVNCASSYFKKFLERYGLDFALIKSNGNNQRYISGGSAEYMRNALMNRKRTTVEAAKTFSDFKYASQIEDGRYATVKTNFLAGLAKSLIKPNSRIDKASAVEFITNALKEDYLVKVIGEITNLNEQTIEKLTPNDVLRILLRSAGLSIQIPWHIPDAPLKLDGLDAMEKQQASIMALPVRREQPTIEQQAKNKSDNVYLMVNSDVNSSKSGETLHNYIYKDSKPSLTQVVESQDLKRARGEIETQIRIQGVDPSAITLMMDWLKDEPKRVRDMIDDQTARQTPYFECGDVSA